MNRYSSCTQVQKDQIWNILQCNSRYSLNCDLDSLTKNQANDLKEALINDEYDTLVNKGMLRLSEQIHETNPYYKRSEFITDSGTSTNESISYKFLGVKYITKWVEFICETRGRYISSGETDGSLEQYIISYDTCPDKLMMDKYGISLDKS